MAKEDAV